MPSLSCTGEQICEQWYNEHEKYKYSDYQQGKRP